MWKKLYNQFLGLSPGTEVKIKIKSLQGEAKVRVSWFNKPLWLFVPIKYVEFLLNGHLINQPNKVLLNMLIPLFKKKQNMQFSLSRILQLWYTFKVHIVLHSLSCDIIFLSMHPTALSSTKHQHNVLSMEVWNYSFPS